MRYYVVDVVPHFLRYFDYDIHLHARHVLYPDVHVRDALSLLAHGTH